MYTARKQPDHYDELTHKPNAANVVKRRADLRLITISTSGFAATALTLPTQSLRVVTANYEIQPAPSARTISTEEQTARDIANLSSDEMMVAARIGTHHPLEQLRRILSKLQADGGRVGYAAAHQYRKPQSVQGWFPEPAV